MKIRGLYFVLIIGIVLVNSCTSTKDDDTSICGATTIINADEFVNAPADQITINSLEIIEDCLKINFSSSGCSGDTWQLKLIDSGKMLKSLPPQRILRLSFKNEEACEAFITKELSFDISKLQIGEGPVQLNITNNDESILYTY